MRTKFKELALIGVILCLGSWASANTVPTNPLQFVPNGKLLQSEGKEYKIQTPEGSVVEVELNRKGELDEASGDLAEKDVFVPGQGLLALDQALNAVKEQGKSPSGEWSLEYSMIRGWYYEFNEKLNGQEIEYLVSAKDGKILKEKIDN